MRRLLFLLPVAALIACGDTLVGELDEDIVGNYDLISVDGNPLPITFVDTDTLQVEITAAEMFVGVNGAFREIDTFRLTRESGVTMQVDTFTGAWTFTTGNLVSFTTQTSQGPLTLPGAWNGTNAITLNLDGVDWVWRHR